FRVQGLIMRGDLDPCAVFRTWKWLRRIRADVLVTNMDKELRFGGLAARLAGIRCIVPRRGIDYPLKNTWMYRLSYTRIAARIVANSEATKRALLKNSPWLSEDRIRVIYNGIDPRPFKKADPLFYRKKAGFRAGDIVFGFVGQLDERKGVDNLVEAFRHFGPSHPSSRLLIVGKGPLESVLKKKCLGIGRQVFFSGYVENIEQVMKSLDVLLLPSLWEGFGIVLIEAMAAGKPVIATRVSNIPEIVSHGRDGFLVPPRDPSAICRYMDVLYHDSGLRKRMGSAGVRKVGAHFTLEIMADAYESLFKECIREHGG
ncbi:glycosyltransferase family 4 protein, partial [bacterium]|nr:glycosyltransferase family 4 protein [bacterium]